MATSWQEFSFPSTVTGVMTIFKEIYNWREEGCVCVCVRERERERESVYVYQSSPGDKRNSPLSPPWSFTHREHSTLRAH